MNLFEGKTQRAARETDEHIAALLRQGAAQREMEKAAGDYLAARQALTSESERVATLTTEEQSAVSTLAHLELLAVDCHNADVHFADAMRREAAARRYLETHQF